MVREGVENSKIMAILKQYKNTLNDFIDSSNLESSDWVGPIDKKIL